MVGYYLYLGLRTHVSCVLLGYFAGGTKEDSLTGYISFFSAQLHAHVSRAEMSYTVLE